MEHDTAFDSPVQIPLTNGYAATVSPEDTDLLDSVWSCQANDYKGNVTRYALRKISNVTILMHRVIMERVLGRLLEAHELVDHWNRDGLDNRRANLRLATKIQNGQNRKVNSNNKSGYKGVSHYKRNNTWRVSVNINGKHTTLGYYDTPEMAAYAYNQAALEHFGGFAKLNDLPEAFNPSPQVPRPIGRPKGSKTKVQQG